MQVLQALGAALPLQNLWTILRPGASRCATPDVQDNSLDPFWVSVSSVPNSAGIPGSLTYRRRGAKRGAVGSRRRQEERQVCTLNGLSWRRGLGVDRSGHARPTHPQCEGGLRAPRKPLLHLGPV